MDQQNQQKKNNLKFEPKKNSLNEEDKLDNEFIEEAKQKMKKLDEEPISKDYTLNNVPKNYPNESQKSDPNLETIYTSDRERNLFVYELSNLYNKDINSSVRFSQNIIKIGFIDPTKVKKIKAFEISDFDIELTAELSSNPQDNSTEYTMSHIKRIVFQNETFLNELNLKVISIGTELTKENINNLYIMKAYNQPYSRDGIVFTKSSVLQKLTDFKTRDGSSIIPILQEPLKNEIIKKIIINFPRTMLLGNIKIIGKIKNDLVYPKLLINSDQIAFPMLSMPIEINPKVKILQQWLTEQILPWEEAKQFIDEKSVLDLIKIEAGTEIRKEIIPNARATAFEIGYQKGTTTTTPGWPFSDKIDFTDKKMVVVNSYSGGGGQPLYDVISTSAVFRDIEVEIKDAPAIDGLQKVLLNMLSYTYNYNRNFDGASLSSDPDKMNEMDKLRAKFVGQKPNDVITNLFNEWKLDNPKYINTIQVKRFKQIVLMLSNYILSDLSINQGLNDDNRVWLPYFFELTSTPIHVNSGDVWNFKDVKVKLSSFYFLFTKNENNILIDIKNNDLSTNPLLMLADNQYNWLSITEKLEANNIPSLLPKDITLSDGEFGKYFTRIIVNKNNIEKLLMLLGSKTNLYTKLDWFTEISKIQTESNFEAIISDNFDLINRIEISGIYGQGQYSFSLITDKDKKIRIENIELFSNNDESNSYVNIEF